MDAKACERGQILVEGRCQTPKRYTRFGLDKNTNYVLMMDGTDLVGRLPLDPIIEAELKKKGWRK